MHACRETGLPHLYTIEANYNMARTLNRIPSCSGEGSGRASPPLQQSRPSRFGAHSWQQVCCLLLEPCID
jgi:hypothetical protein